MRYPRRLLGLFFAAALSVAVPAVSGSAAHASTTYAMQLSSTSAAVHAVGTTRTTASFCPQPSHIGATSTLTLTTASTSPSGAFVVTVIAITESSDPIGTSTTFGLTIN
jgi:hypothetical protein